MECANNLDSSHTFSEGVQENSIEIEKDSSNVHGLSLSILIQQDYNPIPSGALPGVGSICCFETNASFAYHVGVATNTVEEIKNRLSIVEVVSSYVPLQKAGVHYKARCPFHNEKTPSFLVSPERGSYHCFGCGVGGDMFSFVQAMDGVDFKGALKTLAEKAGVQIVYDRKEKKDDVDVLYTIMNDAAVWFAQQLSQDHPARAYLKRRGLNEDTIGAFNVGWAPDSWRDLYTALSEKYSEKDLLRAGLLKQGDRGTYDKFRSRIMFPLRDAVGRTIAFSGRIFAPEGTPVSEETAKYMNSPETELFKKSKVFFGFDTAKQAIRKHNFTILVEGQMDLLAVFQAGWHNVVASSGTALSLDHVMFLRRFSDNLLLALDADSAGVAAAQKVAMLALTNKMDVKIARLKGGKDPADLILEKGKEEWNGAVRDASHVIDYLLDVIEASSKDARAFLKEAEKSVLPFVAFIQSPIDKDFFIRRVADRLQVDESAVRRSVEGQKQAPAQVVEKKETPARMSPVVSPKLLEMWAMCEIEKKKEAPAFAVADVEKRLLDILPSFYETVSAAPETEKHAALFRIENEGREPSFLRDSVEILLTSIRRDALAEQYEKARNDLREAENKGEEERVGELLKLCTSLAQELAKTG